MRIVQINAVYGVMSTGRTCAELTKRVRELGHECLTFYGEHPADYGDEAVFMGDKLSHKMHALTGRLYGEAGIGSWRATSSLIRQLEEYRPDVVHLRNLHGNYVHVPMLLRYLAASDTPTVVSLHDCYFFTGGCMHYTSNHCDGWQHECRNCKFLKRGKDYLLANMSATNLKRKTSLFSAIPRLAVCGVSRWTANEAAKSQVFGNAPIITHIYNWIDLNTFRPAGPDKDARLRAELGIKTGPMILGVASGWSNQKGLDDFCKLAQLLPNATIVLVGKMPQIDSLPSNIKPIGSAESLTKLASLYSAADIFVHLSAQETFGKVTAEALACGTPAIVYDSTASPELIDANTGSVVPVGDIEAVAHAVNTLACNPIACRNRATTLFNLTTNIDQQLDIYRRTIELNG